MKRVIKIALTAIAAVLLLYTALSVVGAVLIMRIPRLHFSGTSASVGLPYNDVSFSSRDSSITLKGWFIHGNSPQVVLIVHGGFETRIDQNVDTYGLIRDLADKGYSVLTFDLRGRGESAGTGLSMETNQNDIGGAIDYLKSQGYSGNNIDLIGFCSGAATSAIFLSSENIGAAVLDGCYATVSNMVTTQATTIGIPKLLLDTFFPGVRISVKLFYGYSPVDPIKIVAGIKCPVLFIHEANDDLVSAAETTQLFQAAANTADQRWEIPGALHSQGYKSDPSDYINMVDSFFQNNKPH